MRRRLSVLVLLPSDRGVRDPVRRALPRATDRSVSLVSRAAVSPRPGARGAGGRFDGVRRGPPGQRLNAPTNTLTVRGVTARDNDRDVICLPIGTFSSPCGPVRTDAPRSGRRLPVTRPRADAAVSPAGRLPSAGDAGRRSRYDVVVVGGGHNGLVAAAYLARAGRSVLVLERLPRSAAPRSAGRSSRASTSGCRRTPTWSACCPTGSSPTSGCESGCADRSVASYTAAVRDGRPGRAAGRARRGPGDRDLVPAS